MLSLFPGIDLFGMAFEEEGYCVVRGPDLLWGGDIRRFHPPAGVFDGVIGGPPCQAFSRLRHMVEANGYETAPNLIPEFERCVEEAAPTWFVMENVPAAPVPIPSYYQVQEQVLCDLWVGGATERKRRFSFGSQEHLPFHVEGLALHPIEAEHAVVVDGRAVPVKMLAGGKVKTRSAAVRRSVADMAELQGVPRDFLDGAPFTASAKRKAIGNAVPLSMGRAIAKAVKRATEVKT